MTTVIPTSRWLGIKQLRMRSHRECLCSRKERVWQSPPTRQCTSTPRPLPWPHADHTVRDVHRLGQGWAEQMAGLCRAQPGFLSWTCRHSGTQPSKRKTTARKHQKGLGMLRCRGTASRAVFQHQVKQEAIPQGSWGCAPWAKASLTLPCHLPLPSSCG